MKIVLNQTGGLSGKHLKAEAVWPHSKKDYEKMLNTIKRKKIPKNERKPDSFTYTLELSSQKESITVIDPNKIPELYHPFFKALFESLKVTRIK